MHKASNEKLNLKKTTILLFVHCIFGILLCVVLFSLLSILILNGTFDISKSESGSYAAVFLGTMTASILSCSHFGKKFFTAIIQALCTFGCYYLLGLMLFFRFLPTRSIITVLFACVLGSISGAVLAAIFQGSRRRK